MLCPIGSRAAASLRVRLSLRTEIGLSGCLDCPPVRSAPGTTVISDRCCDDSRFTSMEGWLDIFSSKTFVLRRGIMRTIRPRPCHSLPEGCESDSNAFGHPRTRIRMSEPQLREFVVSIKTSLSQMTEKRSCQPGRQLTISHAGVYPGLMVSFVTCAAKAAKLNCNSPDF